MKITDEDYEKICEAAGVADFVDGQPVFPTVDELVRVIERGRSLADACDRYWSNRTRLTQGDLSREGARKRWLVHILERSRSGSGGRG